jgi:uncharacterized membrane protein
MHSVVEIVWILISWLNFVLSVFFFLSAIVHRFFRRNKLDMGHRTFVDAMRVTSLFFPYF